MPARKPPAVVARKRTRSTEMPMARAAGALSPVVRKIRPQRVFLKPQPEKHGERHADQEQWVHVERLAHRGDRSSHSPIGIDGSRGAVGWM